MASSVADEPSRGVNWFEGGRRISKLLMAIVAAIGAFILIGTNAQTPTFFTAGPGEPWRFETEECKSPDYSRYATDAGSETVMLCFEALPNGKIPYAVAPEPADAAKARQDRLARESAEAAAEAKARGDPPPLIRVEEPKWYYSGDPYNDVVMTYLDQQERAFRLTPQMTQEVRNSSSRRLWAARRKAWKDDAPWVFGIVAAIWVFTAVVGWIVRGFAGVPMGSDFRPRKTGRAAVE